MEVWKDIKGYEGIYQAGSCGNIRTHPDKTTFTNRHGTRKWKCRILKGRGDFYATGKRVTLWKDGKCKDFLVARLVAFTFFNEDINNHDLTVNHINGNRLDNSIENLELISLADNIRHAFNFGLISTGKSVEVVNLKNGEAKKFISLSKASLYIGKSNQYLSNSIKQRKFKNEKYSWSLI